MKQKFSPKWFAGVLGIPSEVPDVEFFLLFFLDWRFEQPSR